jgi:6,7-dimethyl-8-ribityllumazine synthase
MLTVTEKTSIKNITTGIPNIKDACVVIIKTEWNAAIVDALETSCIKTLQENGVMQCKSFMVPGAVELPFAVKTIAQQLHNKVAAFIVIGCVIKGDTPHFEYVCNIVSNGITQLQLQLPMPVIFGVLTVNNTQQAIDRIENGAVGDKGMEAALTALKMIAFTQQTF